MATTTSMTISKWKQMIWNGRYVKHLYCAPRDVFPVRLCMIPE